MGRRLFDKKVRIENVDFVRSSKILPDSISDETRTKIRSRLNHVQLKKEFSFSDETYVTHFRIGED